MIYENDETVLETFGTLKEFHNAVSTRELAPKTKARFGDNATSSHKKRDDEDNWSGTSTWEEAEQIFQNGYTVGADDLRKAVTQFMRGDKRIESMKPRMTVNVAGYAPCIPNYLSGHPRTMYTNTMRKKTEFKRCVRLYLQNVANCDVPNENLLKTGAVMLNVAHFLEMCGYRTEIWIMPFFSASRSSRRARTRSAGCAVKIKDYRDNFNFQKLAYPIAHTSMFRRHGFSWLETSKSKVVKDGDFINHGYGRQTSYAKDLLEHLGVFEKDDIYLSYEMVANEGNFDTIDTLKMLGYTK